MWRKIIQSLYQAVRCPLNHRWQIVREDGKATVQVCQRCGKRQERHW